MKTMTGAAPTPAHGDRLPSVSVLLPAWNDADLVGRCLESLLAIDWPDLEIVVCAGGRDATLEVARRYAGDRVVVLEQRPGEGKQAALRRCLERSRGEVIYLTDADCVVPEDSFRAVVAPIAGGRYQAATGYSLPLSEQGASALVRYQWARDALWARQQGELAGGVLGRHAAIRRATLEALGGFADDVPSGTDYHLSQRLRRAGVAIAWTPGHVHSEYPATPAAYLRMWRRWIKNVLVQGTTTGSYREVTSTAVGVGVSGALLALPVGALLFRRWIALPWLGLFAWVASRRLRDHHRAVRLGIAPPVGRPALRVPAFVLLDAAAAVSGLVAALVPGMRNRW